jgi:hypothetical protein
MGIDNIVTLAAALFLGVVAFLFGRKGKSQPPLPRPDNTVARDVASGTIQQTFQESVDGIEEDLNDDDAAELLAQRGNSRRRRGSNK